MLFYAKGEYQLSIVKEDEHYKFIKENKSSVMVERGTKEDMKCLFNTWVTLLRKPKVSL